MGYFTEMGYLGLFLASFLAAPILPLSSAFNGFRPLLIDILGAMKGAIGWKMLYFSRTNPRVI